MQEPGFWDDIKRAEEVTKESKRIKDKIDRFDSLVTRVEDVEVLAELIEEDDEESINEVIAEIRSIEKDVDEYRIEILLSGEYDRNDTILTLHAGVGGSDANDWTEMLLRMYTRWCEKKGFKVETIDYLEGDEAGIKSVTLKVKGEFAYGYLKAEKGVHRLVRISPFNANGKRQTSFASLEVSPVIDNFERGLKMDDNDLSDEVSKFLSGFKMIYGNLSATLQSYDIHVIDALHQPFDHNTMEAVMTEEVEGIEPNQVIDVLQKGYTYKGKVIRYAMVKVSK